MLIASPYYLNDFANIYVRNWVWWLVIDYVGVKLYSVLVVFWVLWRKKMRPSEFGLTPQPVVPFVVVFLITALVGTLIDQNAGQLLKNVPGYPALGGMPEIKSPTWDWIDLTFGLVMVGVLEELIFRGYMHTFLSRYTQSPAAIVVVSSIAFGFIHWSNGSGPVVSASIIGAVFMIAYLYTRSLPAIMLAHFAVDFVDFAGVIPKSIFKFF